MGAVVRWHEAVAVARANSLRHGVRYRVYAVRWAYGRPRWRWFVCPLVDMGSLDG